MTTLYQLRQRCHRNEGNNCNCNKGNNHYCNDGRDACALMATMPLRQGQQCHRNDGKDACALMMMTMPFQQGQRHQLEDDNNAIATRATTPSQIKGNNTIVPRATTPAWQRQGCLCINNGNDPIVMRATIAITTIAKTPAHQW